MHRPLRSRSFERIDRMPPSLSRRMVTFSLVGDRTKLRFTTVEKLLGISQSLITFDIASGRCRLGWSSSSPGLKPGTCVGDVCCF